MMYASRVCARPIHVLRTAVAAVTSPTIWPRTDVKGGARRRRRQRPCGGAHHRKPLSPHLARGPLAEQQRHRVPVQQVAVECVVVADWQHELLKAQRDKRVSEKSRGQWRW